MFINHDYKLLLFFTISSFSATTKAWCCSLSWTNLLHTFKTVKQMAHNDFKLYSQYSIPSLELNSVNSWHCHILNPWYPRVMRSSKLKETKTSFLLDQYLQLPYHCRRLAIAFHKIIILLCLVIEKDSTEMII